MPLDNKERQARFVEKMKREGKDDERKRKHAETMRKSRSHQKQIDILLPKHKLEHKRQQERKKLNEKVKLCRQRKKEKELCRKSPKAFNSAIAFAKATARVKKALPNSPRRKLKVARKLFAEVSNELSVTPGDAPKQTRATALNCAVINMIKMFYVRDDVSRQAPGKKDVITVRQDDGGKDKIQIRHLTSSIKEVFAMFKDDHPNVKVGLSKFHEHRPKHVLIASKLPHNMCCCKYHDNFIYAVNGMHMAVPTFPAYDKSFPERCICKPPTDSCWYNDCDKCCNGQGFLEEYNSVINESRDQHTSWTVWIDSDGRLIKSIDEGNITDLRDHIISILPKFIEHCHIKREQATSYNIQRASEEVSSDKYNATGALLQIDFSENYTCVYQDEIQTAHWNQKQVSLFTAAVWHSGVLHPIVFASDNLDHSKMTIIAYVHNILKEIPKEVTHVDIWSDGPSSQFNNRFIFAALPELEKNLNLSICWHYFATSHGKGPVDGIGGTVKRNVWAQVKSRKHVVTDATTFCMACCNMKGVNVLKMSSADIESVNELLSLQNIFENAQSIPGISRVHCLNNGVSYKLTNESILDQNVTDGHSKTSIVCKFEPQILNVGDWCIVQYDNDVFPGEVLKISGNVFQVSVMSPSGSNWRWPTPRDSIFYNAENVLGKIDDPIPVNSRGMYRFSKPFEL